MVVRELADRGGECMAWENGIFAKKIICEVYGNSRINYNP